MRTDAPTPLNLPRVRAPKLPSDPKRWLNTGGRAITLADLKRRTVTGFGR